MAVGVYVVVEAVLDCRADTEFHSGIKFLESLGEKVGGGMPESMLAFRVIPFEKFDGSILIDRAAQIPFLIIDRCGQHISGELRRKAAGDFKGCHPGFVLFYRIIGKSNVNHYYLRVYQSIATNNVATKQQYLRVLTHPEAPQKRQGRGISTGQNAKTATKLTKKIKYHSF